MTLLFCLKLMARMDEILFAQDSALSLFFFFFCFFCRVLSQSVSFVHSKYCLPLLFAGTLFCSRWKRKEEFSGLLFFWKKRRNRTKIEFHVSRWRWGRIEKTKSTLTLFSLFAKCVPIPRWYERLFAQKNTCVPFLMPFLWHHSKVCTVQKVRVF